MIITVRISWFLENGESLFFLPQALFNELN